MSTLDLRYFDRGGNDRVCMVWNNMIARCYHEKSNRYARYGGRGVGVCAEWRASVHTFKKWALSHGWEYGLQLDRIDNDGDYSPENCHFVTPSVNMANRSNNIIIEWRGKRQCLMFWCQELGIPYMVLYRRYKRGEKGEELFRSVRARV
jgi:hypothetical protein